MSNLDAVILGAGVLGLSIAHEMMEKGYKVAILARDLPEDLHSTAFASPWAGANWASYATNDKEVKRDSVTYRRLEKMAVELPHLVQKVDFRHVWKEQDGYTTQWYQDFVGGGRSLNKDELPPAFNCGLTFKSFTINTPHYLAWLAHKLRSGGVQIIRRPVSSLDEAYVALGPVSLVINATGLGARTLLGVQDELVHPVKGQTVLVKAAKGYKPINYGVKDPERMMSSGTSTYIIPRAGYAPPPLKDSAAAQAGATQDGEEREDGKGRYVILGGIALKDDWNTQPDFKTAERILKEAYALEPSLSGGKGWEAIEVVSHNVGLRPAREGGMRLQLEERTIGQGINETLLLKEVKERIGQPVAVVHAYGIGPAGYQASWGIAEEVTEIAEQYLQRRE